MLAERADLLCELVDDLVRVGWNLSQNKSPFNAKPPQSDWIAGVEKNWNAGLVGGGHRVDTSNRLQFVQGEGASEIRLHVRQSDGRAGIIECGEHATLIVTP